MVMYCFYFLKSSEYYYFMHIETNLVFFKRFNYVQIMFYV